MLKWITAPDDVVALSYTGKVTKADVDECFEVVRQRLARHETLAAVVDLSAWQGFAADGLLEDLRAALPALKWAGRIRRKAIVTGSHAWTVWVEIAGSLIDRPELKVFAPAAVDEALRWASE